MISYYGSMTRMAYDENGTRQQGTDFNPEANPLYNQLTAVMYAEQIKHMMDIAYLDTDFDTTEYKAKIDKVVAETNFNNFNDKDFAAKIDDLVKTHPEFVKKYGDNEAKFTDLLQSELTKSEKIDLLKSLKKKLDIFEAKYRSLWLNNDQARIMYFGTYCLFAGDPLGMDAEKEGLAIFKAIGISDQEIEQLQKFLENTK